MTFSIYLIQTVAFLDLLGVALIVPLVGTHVLALGGSHLMFGLMGSVYNVFQLFSGPMIGCLSDIKGRRTILMVTLVVSSAAYIIMGVTGSIIVLLLMRAVLGLFKQTQVLTKALVGDYEKNEKRQSEIYGKMAAISGVGITIGPVIGGHLAEDHPEDAFVLIGTLVGLIFLINTGLVYWLPKVKCKRRKPIDKNQSTKSFIQILMCSFQESIQELYKIQWSKFWDLFLFKGLVAFAMAMHYSNYTVYLKSSYNLTPKYIGYVISFQGIIGSLSCYFIGFINSFYTKDKDFSLRNFHVFTVLSMSVLGLIYSFNVYTYAFWLMPLAIGNSVGRLVTMEMVLKRGHGEHRGTLIGASNSVRSLAGIIAPTTAGFIGEYIGVGYVLHCSLIVTLVGTILSYYNHTHRINKRD